LKNDANEKKAKPLANNKKDSKFDKAIPAQTPKQ